LYDEILFVSATSFVDQNSPIELIKAFGEVHGKKRRHLVLLGNGPLLQTAKQLASQYSNISLKGEVTDADEYLEVADCFVPASLSGGLPNSVTEALAVGLPIILSDIPVHQEIQQIQKISDDLFLVQNRCALIKLIQNFRPSDSAARADRSIVMDHLN
jgi:glycosyltransferase involved in cell wall biosynthesis